MGKGSSASASQGMPRFSGKGGIASQQSPQNQYASPLAGLGAIYGQYQQPSPQPSRNMMYRSEPEYQPQSSYITTPYAAPFQSQYQPMINMYTRPTRQIPAAFVPQSAKNYIAPFGKESQKEQTYFDLKRGTTPPTPTPSPDDYYYPPMASGGVIKAAAGRYLQGPGDGTSDSIPATIGNAQPARLADGEFVIDARTVSEIGNGSSNAGAKKLYAMMERVHRERKRAKRGQNSNADRFLPR